MDTIENALKRVESIYDTIAKVIEISKRDGIATYVVRDRLAEERIASLKNSRSTYLRNGHDIISRR